MKRFFILLSLLFCATATAHTINWYADGNKIQTTTCESGDNITPPTIPAKYGYDFTKWFYVNKTDIPIAGYAHMKGSSCMRYLTSWSGYACNNLPDLKTQEFKIEYNDYTIYGKALCSNTEIQAEGLIGIPDESDNTGGYCWCKATYLGINGYLYAVNGPWIQNHDYGGNSGCLIYCSGFCASQIKENSNNRRTSFVQIQPVFDDE